MLILFFEGLLAIVSAAETKTPAYLDETKDLPLKRDGIFYEDVENILSTLYHQKMSSMEKEMAELREVVMKQRENMKKTDKFVAKLQYRINEQDSKIEGMKHEIRKISTKDTEKEIILKQVIKENKKCVAQFQSVMKSIESIEQVVSIGLNNENNGSGQIKDIFQNNKKVKVSQKKKRRKSSTNIINVSDKIASLRNGNNFYKSKVHGADNISTLKTGINYSSGELDKDRKEFRKQFRKRKEILHKRDVAAEGIAFSAYLDHDIYHMGAGHTIKCNQIILNDGGHYNTFTGVFSVPQTGVYLLSFSFGVEHINDWTEVKLIVNNREIVDASGQVLGSAQRLTSGNTAIIKLNQGESVWLEAVINDSDRRTTFSGALLY